MDLTLQDLHNPKKITRLFHFKRQHWIVKADDQGWQEYPRSVELWQKMDDGKLIRIQRWLKTSVGVYCD